MELEDSFFTNCSKLLSFPDFEMNISACDFMSAIYESSKNQSFVKTNFTTQRAVTMIMELLFFIIFIAGVTGNSIVLYVVTRYSKIKSVTNLYIINLALSDLLFLMGIPFLMTTYINRFWIFGHLMCKLYMVNTSLNQFTSSLFLTIMSADRYVAVCHPINSPRCRTTLISKIVCFTAWMVSALMIAPVFMYATTLETPEQVSCNLFWPSNGKVTETYLFSMYSFLLSFAMPVLLIFTFYSMVIWKLKSSRGNNFILPSGNRKNPRQSRVTRMVLALITVYLVCWIPYWILQMSLIKDEPAKMHSNFMIICFHVSSFLTYANSAINPVLYTFLSDNFKNSFKEAFPSIQRLKHIKARRPATFLMRRIDKSKPGASLPVPEEVGFTAASSDETRPSGNSANGKQLTGSTVM